MIGYGLQPVYGVQPYLSYFFIIYFPIFYATHSTYLPSTGNLDKMSNPTDIDVLLYGNNLDKYLTFLDDLAKALQRMLSTRFHSLGSIMEKVFFLDFQFRCNHVTLHLKHNKNECPLAY